MEQDPPSPPSSEPPTQRAKFNEKRELAIKDAFNVNRELSRLFDETFPDVFNDFHSSEKTPNKTMNERRSVSSSAVRDFQASIGKPENPPRTLTSKKISNNATSQNQFQGSLSPSPQPPRSKTPPQTHLSPSPQPPRSQTPTEFNSQSLYEPKTKHHINGPKSSKPLIPSNPSPSVPPAIPSNPLPSVPSSVVPSIPPSLPPSSSKPTLQPRPIKQNNSSKTSPISSSPQDIRVPTPFPKINEVGPELPNSPPPYQSNLNNTLVVPQKPRRPRQAPSNTISKEKSSPKQFNTFNPKQLAKALDLEPILSKQMADNNAEFKHAPLPGGRKRSSSTPDPPSLETINNVISENKNIDKNNNDNTSTSSDKRKKGIFGTLRKATKKKLKIDDDLFEQNLLSTGKEFNGAQVIAISDSGTECSDMLSYKAGDVMYILDKFIAPRVTTSLTFEAYFKGKTGRVKAYHFKILEKLPQESDMCKKKLLELIAKPDFTIAWALCLAIGSQEYQVVGRLLVKLYQANGNLMDFLFFVMDQEIEKTPLSSSNTLFRGTSITISLLNVYARLVGQSYLSKLIGPLISQVTSSTLSLEINPIQTSEDVKQNAVNLLYIVENFFNLLVNSINDIPVEIKNICNLLYNTVSQKFPDYGMTVVGSFFSLRFLTPAIISPEGFNLSQTNIDPTKRRSLVLISKVVQHCFNGTEFSEEFMKPLNPFIQKKNQIMQNFVLTLCQAPYNQTYKKNSDVSQMLLASEEFVQLHEHISYNLSKIRKQVDDMSDFVQTLDYNPFETLLSLLAGIGEISHKPSSNFFSPPVEQKKSIRKILSKFLMNRPKLSDLKEKKIWK